MSCVCNKRFCRISDIYDFIDKMEFYNVSVVVVLHSQKCKIINPMDLFALDLSDNLKFEVSGDEADVEDFISSV